MPEIPHDFDENRIQKYNIPYNLLHKKSLFNNNVGHTDKDPDDKETRLIKTTNYLSYDNMVKDNEDETPKPIEGVTQSSRLNPNLKSNPKIRKRISLKSVESMNLESSYATSNKKASSYGTNAYAKENIDSVKNIQAKSNFNFHNMRSVQGIDTGSPANFK